jgi:FAD/FMN-containing dehydrogenase
MATETRHSTARDEQANYDYVSSDVERPGLVSDLEEFVDGDVRFDTYTRQLYATDASAYERTPIGVVMPKHTDDVAAVMEYCADEGIPVLPRGGGTSLAGQTVNEAVVLDLAAEMTDVVEVDAEIARAQAGVRFGDRDAELDPDGVKFAPGPASNRARLIEPASLSGSIPNPSGGRHCPRSSSTSMSRLYPETLRLRSGYVAAISSASLSRILATVP